MVLRIKSAQETNWKQKNRKQKKENISLTYLNLEKKVFSDFVVWNIQGFNEMSPQLRVNV